jgi:hypothetical protein
MIAVSPHPPPPVNGAVDGPRTTDGQPLCPARERESPVGLDDEVDVVRLDREDDDAEESLAGNGQRPVEGGVHRGGSEGREARASTERDMNRVPCPVQRAPTVRRRGPRSRAPTSRVRAPSPPGARGGERELLSTAAAHSPGPQRLSATPRDSCVVAGPLREDLLPIQGNHRLGRRPLGTPGSALQSPDRRRGARAPRGGLLRIQDRPALRSRTGT